MINFDLIKTLDDVKNELRRNEELRDECYKEILDSTIFSKFTNVEGVITDINEKTIFVNYESWESIPLKLDRYKESLITEDYLTKIIDDYLSTYKDERKLKRLIKKFEENK